MATRNSTWKAGSGRNRLDPDAESDPAPLLNPLEEAIENERSRLGRAEAVLDCLRLSLLYVQEGEESDPPDFAEVAAVAKIMVRGAINGLDSVAIGPLIEGLAATGTSKRRPSAGR